MQITMTISEGHWDALCIIISEACPYVDQRDVGPAIEQMIEEWLAREGGVNRRYGSIVNDKWIRKEKETK